MAALALEARRARTSRATLQRRRAAVAARCRGCALATKARAQSSHSFKIVPHYLQQKAPTQSFPTLGHSTTPALFSRERERERGSFCFLCKPLWIFSLGLPLVKIDPHFADENPQADALAARRRGLLRRAVQRVAQVCAQDALRTWRVCVGTQRTRECAQMCRSASVQVWLRSRERRAATKALRAWAKFRLVRKRLRCVCGRARARLVFQRLRPAWSRLVGVTV